MNYITWSEDIKVNVQEIDHQHENFVKLVNELYELIGTEKIEATKYLMKQIITELRNHFDAEERLMKTHKYVDYFSHKMEHDRYYLKLENFYEDLIHSRAKINLELFKSLNQWFFNHIELNDAKLGKYLNSINIF